MKTVCVTGNVTKPWDNNVLSLHVCFYMFLKRQRSILLMLLVFNASSHNEVRKCTTLF